MKAAIYVRVSLDKEADDPRFQDPANQVEPLKRKAEELGADISDIYIDRVTGGTSNRPEFIRMRMDAHQRKFNVLLVWSLDRFCREGIGPTFNYISDLHRYGVGVVSLQESWLDTRTGNKIGELLMAVISWVAEQERIRISERTKAGIRRRRAIGQWKGGRPAGSKDRKPRKKRGGGATNPEATPPLP
jgi:DNA invertase Pin-like site-specific DNA recombinase